MKHLHLLFILFFIVLHLTAQPHLQWQKSFGGTGIETANSAQQTRDGGYILAGFTFSNNNGDVLGVQGAGDFWVVKLDSTGALQWQKPLGGSSTDIAYAIRQTSDGGYIVTGIINSDDGQVSGYHGNGDYWVVKLNETGDIAWQKALGGSSRDEAYAIAEAKDGGYLVGGRSVSTDGDVIGNQGYYDLWVVKLDVLGNINWQRSLGGSTGAEVAYSIDLTNDGGYILAGVTSSNDGDVSGYHGSEDYWVVKLDSIGGIEWQRALGGSGIDNAWSVTQTTDGGYIVAGASASGNTGDVSGANGGFDFWVVKLDFQGNIQWQQPLGGTDQDWGRYVQEAPDGGYVVAGITRSNDGDVYDNDGYEDYWLIKLSNSGNILMEKSLGGMGSETAIYAQQTSDGGYFIAGTSESMDGDVTGSHGKGDIWVVKLSPESVNTQAPPSPSPAALEIYPNPASNTVFLKTPQNDSIIGVEISDMLGREMLRFNNPGMESLEVRSLPNGVYLLTATDTTGKRYAGMLYKR